MKTAGVAEAKARLSELLSYVESGEEVLITRQGKPVGKLTAAGEGRVSPFDFEELRAFVAATPEAPAREGMTVAEMRERDVL